MVVRVPEGESFGRMRRDSERLWQHVTDLERTDGSQYARALEKIKSLIAGLDAQVAAAITANSYTRAELDGMFLVAGSAAVDAGRISGVVSPGKGGTGTSNVHSTTGTGTQLQVYVKPDGGLTVGASSERFKSGIEEWVVDYEALLSLPPRIFEWLSEPGVTDVGLIAEEAYRAGLHWLVRFDGPVIEGIRYERLPVALLGFARWQHERFLSLVARVDALEGGV